MSSTRPSPPRICTGMVAASLLLVAGACSGTGDGVGSAERADDAAVAGADAGEPTTVTVLDPNYEAIFNPSWSMPARFLVFSPLVGVGPNGETEPRLARRWEHSDDYREWTFHLRSDVRWHDGEPFDAGDVAFTIRRMSHPEVAARRRTDTVVVADDSTVVVRYERPTWALDWWSVYYPEHLLADVPPSAFFDAEFWTRPVGTGPFRYVRHEPKTVFELESNPDYFRGEPAVDRVRIKFGGGAPVMELESGNVDAVTYLSRAQVPRLEADPRFRVYHSMAPDAGWLEVIYYNHRHPLLGDVRVRRALTMAIDRDELRRLFHMPEELPIFDVLVTGRQLRSGELPPPIPHDPTRARALLEEAGWTDDDGDGVRSRGGEDARFEALVNTGGSFATYGWGRAAVYVQEALRDVGIRMEVVSLESGFRDRLLEGDFEAAFYRFFRYRGPGTLWGEESPVGYFDPRLAAIFGAADTLVAPAARDSLHGEAWPILRRDVPMTILAPLVQHFAARRGLRGFRSPYRAHPYVAMEYLRVEGPDE